MVSGDEAWDDRQAYIDEVAPDLAERVARWDGDEDVFAAHRVDEQIAKALDRKVWLPSGGSLVIDRTEAMTVVDVNTGKFTGSGGNLEETVTRNNLEAAEEIVRQLRLRDIGGIIVIDFIDMVLESNRDLVLRRLLECLGRDRTKHQVAEVTSLGLVQMTRKRVGQGLLEAFSEPCEHCHGRGVIVLDEPVERKGGRRRRRPSGRPERQGRRSRQRRRKEPERRPGPGAARRGLTEAQREAAAAQRSAEAQTGARGGAARRCEPGQGRSEAAVADATVAAEEAGADGDARRRGRRARRPSVQPRSRSRPRSQAEAAGRGPAAWSSRRRRWSRAAAEPAPAEQPAAEQPAEPAVRRAAVVASSPPRRRPRPGGVVAGRPRRRPPRSSTRDVDVRLLTRRSRAAAASECAPGTGPV